ncbi:uncharacterized protein LOC120267313 [Dioscorea cayenensis subsp. rotundata]|uniref:Uncharacterized protein LOC120267313 n=1 Tax=Dioscorea cayennensis subsp. rotundata TaxID=55577 RepID=A0AB40BWF5_DIOCR|nr:uncharacterized protein LOC120267313 [Dioscorea cayenensis subsp. rotundata]
MVHYFEFSASIKTFRSDSGGEYTSHAFRTYLSSEGTLPQLSCPGAHPQNGVAERKHRHILETARALLLGASLPPHFWADAVHTAVYLINMQPSSHLQGRSPVLNTKDIISMTRSLVAFSISRDVMFDETTPFYASPPSTTSTSPTVPLSFLFLSHPSRILPSFHYFSHVLLSKDSLSLISYSISLLICRFLLTYHRREPTASSPRPVLSDTPSTADPDPEVPSHTYILRDRSTLHPPDRYATASTSVSHVLEPGTYREAVQSPEWRTAMAEELDALSQTHSWDLVPLPSHATPITYCWIYRVKTRSDGSLERYKACLVARGFQQEHGRDYEETFAPVAHMHLVTYVDSRLLLLEWTYIDLM